jgi:DNA-damage-inducible protein J
MWIGKQIRVFCEMKMTETAVVSARMDSDLKRSAEQIFKEMGLSAAQAIRLFYGEVDRQHSLPFRVKIPNEATRQALREAETRYDLESFNSADGLFEDLGI